MSVTVRVDLNSAVVTYRPAAGEERSVTAQEATPNGLFGSYPWRTFQSHDGQKHYSGTYWSSTLGDHVIYESRLELANLIAADFDPHVERIAAQPFLLTAEVEGQPRRHILDYMWGTDGDPVVVDVVRRERLSRSNIQLLCDWTRIVVAPRSRVAAGVGDSSRGGASTGRRKPPAGHGVPVTPSPGIGAPATTPRRPGPQGLRRTPSHRRHTPRTRSRCPGRCRRWWCGW